MQIKKEMSNLHTFPVTLIAWQRTLSDSPGIAQSRQADLHMGVVFTSTAGHAPILRNDVIYSDNRVATDRDTRARLARSQRRTSDYTNIY